MATEKPTLKKELSASEICAIIKASSEAGVRVLKYHSLCLEFGKPVTEIVTVVNPDPLPLVTAAAEIAELQKTASKESLETQALRAKQDQIDLMLIEDPLQAEELISRGDLEAMNDGSAEET